MRAELKTAVSTCVRSSEDSEGNLIETYYTKLGPLDLHVGETQSFFLLPAGPTTDQTSYLVETVDAYYDENENPISFPPIHPHHSAAFLTGYDHDLTYYGEGVMKGFTAFPVISDATFTRGIWERPGAWPGVFQTSSNVPGFNVDLYGCRKGMNDPASACFYTTFPKNTGMPLYPGHDMWTNSMLVHVSPGHKPSQRLFVEYGRKFVTPKVAPNASSSSSSSSSSTFAPVWSLDFAATGNSDLYPVHGNGSSWHTYTMPVGGKFLSSWFHSHGVSESELWVLDSEAEAVLPQRLLDECARTKNCGSVGTSRGTRRRDVALGPLNLNLDSLREFVEAKAKKSVRCKFKSRNTLVGSDMFGRGALMDTATRASCANWSFHAGQAVTLLLFNEPLRPEVTEVPAFFKRQKAVPQHHRWWPLTELDLPAHQLAKEQVRLAERPDRPRTSTTTTTSSLPPSFARAPGAPAESPGGSGGSGGGGDGGALSSASSACVEKPHKHLHDTCAKCLRHPQGGSCEKCMMLGFDCTCSCGHVEFSGGGGGGNGSGGGSGVGGGGGSGDGGGHNNNRSSRFA